MTEQYHPLIKQLLDGELSLAELPPGLRAEGERALQLLAAVDRTPVVLPAALEQRVMARVRRRSSSPVGGGWRALGGRPDRAERGRWFRAAQQRRRGDISGWRRAGPMRTVVLVVLLAVALAGRILAQGDVAARLGGRLPPAVVTAVRQLADSAAARGLPVDPLVDKAIEGGAKGVPGERVVAAVRVVLK